jgi:hypothetical protein
LERLYFGTRNRRKARLKRYLGWAGVISLVAILLGVPGSDAGLSLIESLTGGPPGILGGESVQSSEDATGFLGIRGKAERSTSSARTRDVTQPGPPLPSPSPLPSGETMAKIIYEAAAEFGISGDYLVTVAQCESALDPGAYNPAGYHGLFQFDYQTWGAYGYGSIYDPVAQARTAAELLADGQTSRWPNCA